MRITLLGAFGPAAGSEADIAAGQRLGVGCAPGSAALAVPGDEHLSDLQFSIECTASECRIRNHAGGITLNGSPVAESLPLSDGDLIAAGQSQFSVRFDSAPLGEVLRKQALPAYAILDAAREQRVPQLLKQSGAHHQSLYEGARGESLASVAPYLVTLSPALTDALVKHAWNKSWAVFLTSRIPFEEIRKHLRHFLMVKDEDGKRMVFRFYDPRVLRVFLPTCQPQECAAFFGGIDRYLMEADGGTSLLRFRFTPEGLVQEEVQLESGGT